MNFEQPPIKKSSEEPTPSKRETQSENPEKPITLESVREDYMRYLTKNNNLELLKNWQRLNEKAQNEFIELETLSQQYHAKKLRHHALECKIHGGIDLLNKN